jgi:hypothetical protein
MGARGFMPGQQDTLCPPCCWVASASVHGLSVMDADTEKNRSSRSSDKYGRQIQNTDFKVEY